MYNFFESPPKGKLTETTVNFITALNRKGDILLIFSLSLHFVNTHFKNEKDSRTHLVNFYLSTLLNFFSNFKMNEKSRQKSIKSNLFVSDKQKEIKFVLYFKNQQIIYEFNEPLYCVLPFSFISSLKSNGNIMKIEFRNFPFYFKFQKKIANYANLNSSINIFEKRNELTSMNSHNIIFNERSKCEQFLDCLINFKSSAGLKINLSTETALPVFRSFEDYFFGDSYLLRNPKANLKRKQDFNALSDNLIKKRNEEVKS